MGGMVELAVGCEGGYMVNVFQDHFMDLWGEIDLAAIVVVAAAAAATVALVHFLVDLLRLQTRKDDRNGFLSKGC